MHPRSDAEVPAEGSTPWSAAQKERAQSVLDFVRERGTVHPRDVDEHFSHGKVRNYWGGTSNASTHLLAAMHYRGMLRVARRQSGVRLYAAHQHGPEPADVADRRERLDALVDAAVQVYAPLPSASLAYLVRRLRYAVPQWRGELTMALKRARQRLAHSRVEGVDWYWPANEKATSNRSAGRGAIADAVRPRGVGSRSSGALVELDLSVRGVHARVQAQARILRVAAPLARPCDRLGQLVGRLRRAPIRARVHRLACTA